jgi:biotin carboxyl carrier protein
MPTLRRLLALTGLLVAAGLTLAGYLTRDQWAPRLGLGQAQKPENGPPAAAVAEAKMLRLTPQARQNLHLQTAPLRPRRYWRRIQVPGTVVDRPGFSDRGITAPVVSVVVKVHAYPGDTVKPGDRLFTLRLLSDYLQNAQAELFKATRDVQLAQQEKDRLMPLVKSGAVAESKIIELDQQLKRLNAVIESYTQDLRARGLSQAQLDSITQGRFASEIEIVAPMPGTERDRRMSDSAARTDSASRSVPDPAPCYEVQELKVDLGKQVQSGEILCVLSNHQTLYIEGRGFKSDAALLEEAAQSDWPLEAEFVEDDPGHWPTLTQTFHIRHLANVVDPESHTFSFFVPLANQSRSYEKDGQTFLVWRFRPGQPVRLHVPVEELKGDPVAGKPGEFQGVLVLPAGALAREGPETYAFRQNGDLFERVPVHVLYEDRFNVVLANDGTFKLPWVTDDGKLMGGDYLAQGAAASLNRVLKAQNSSGGLPPGAHFHADGTLHIPGQ